MRVLVTGVSGFSGSFIAQALAQAGFDVTGLHRRESPRLEALRAVPGVRLVPGDLTGARGLPGPFDGVVHAAATSPAPGVTVADIVRDNIDGTFALIDAALGWQVRAFIFCSSMSVYGAIEDEIVDEGCPIRDPDVYGMTKLLAERRLEEVAAAMPALALRLPGIIGAGAQRNWLSGVAAGLQKGAKIGAFHLDRSFNNAAHVADIAALIDGVLQRGLNGFDTIVLGAAGMTTVRGAIERLAAGLGVTAAIEARAAAKASFTLSSKRAIARYGYDPMPIEAMIDRYASELVALNPRGQ